MTIKELKQGDLFKRKENARAVYVRGHYDRKTNTYSCHKFDDINAEIFLKGKTVVCTDFEF